MGRSGNWLISIFILVVTGSFLGGNTAKQPNIIVLLADDMRYDALGFTGNRIAYTPNLNALSRRGTYFRKAFVTTAICAVSRASILSGQYARRHGIHDFARSFTPDQWKQTYPVLLREHGYYTGFIGKFGVGTKMPASSFDFWQGFSGQGFHWMKDEAGQPIHSTDWMGQQMQRFLSGRNQNQPFCLSVSFKAPHAEDGRKEYGGFLYAPRFDSLYRNLTIPQPLTNRPEYYAQFPAAFKTSDQNRENEGRVRWRGRFDSTNYQTTTKAIYRLVSGIDEVVGQLVETLKQQKLLDNTIIVFTSDNGFYLGEHGMSDKWYGHNESIRVPLLIVDGRTITVPRPVINEFVLNIDVAPTLLAYAGISIPETMQGKALQPLLLGRKQVTWRTHFFYEHLFDPGNASVYIPMSEGIVTERHKLIRYFTKLQADAPIHEELFAWQQDSLEINNLVGKPVHQKLYQTLTNQLKIIRAQSR